MPTIDGYPEQSMTGQFLQWGRANKYAPAFVFDEPSEHALRGVQNELKARHPDAELTEALHATIMYCPPRSLFEAVKKTIRWDNPTVEQEAMFYIDVSNGLSTAILAHAESIEVPVERLETFDENRGVVVASLAQTAFLSKWRESVFELLRYNIGQYYGVSDAQFDALAEDPTFRWLFKPSRPHVSLGANIHATPEQLSRFDLPPAVTLSGIRAKSPEQFLGFRSLLFDPDAAYEDEHDIA